MANYAGEFLGSIRESTVSTTDATVTTIETINLPPDSSVFIHTIIVGRRTGGSAGSTGDSATYEIIAAYKDVSGTATICGTQDIVYNEDVAGWDGAVSVSGPNILVRVTGAANTNINWSAHTKLVTSRI
jgi:hypothetical protein